MQSSLIVILALCAAYVLLPTTPAYRCYQRARFSTQRALPSKKTKCGSGRHSYCKMVTAGTPAQYSFGCGDVMDCGHHAVNNCVSSTGPDSYGAKCCCKGHLCNGDDKVFEAAQKAKNQSAGYEVAIWNTSKIQCYDGDRIGSAELPDSQMKECNASVTMCMMTTHMPLSTEPVKDNYRCATSEECGELVGSCVRTSISHEGSDDVTAGAKCCCKGPICNGHDDVLDAATQALSKNLNEKVAIGDAGDK